MDFEPACDPVGWFVSEKYEGCRAFWDGEQFWTRDGNLVPAPDWFTNEIPKGIQLDGEIWRGRGQFQLARCAVQYGHFDGHERFLVFDAPRARGNWRERITAAAQVINDRSAIACTVAWQVIQSREQLRTIFERIQSLGGEGVVIRNPKITRYETGYTMNMLKIKTLEQLLTPDEICHTLLA
jgi:DNA ligase-1